MASADPTPKPPSVDWRAIARRLVPWLICLGLVVGVLTIYLQVISHCFLICDDNQYVYENPYITEGLTWKGTWWALTACHAGNWHPLSWLSHMLDVQVYNSWLNGVLGPGPHSGWLGDLITMQRKHGWAGAHHLTSVMFHAINAVLLFLAARLMTGRLWCSALLAAAFALHPLRVESVAWISERKDMLSGMFWMLTLLAYGWYAERPGALRYALVVLWLALGLMAKSMLVTVPCLLLLLDVWPLRRWRPPFVSEPGEPGEARRCPPQTLQFLLVEKIPLLAMVLTVAGMVWYSQSSGGAMTMLRGVTFGQCVANAIVSYIIYLWMTVWPVNLAIFYPHPGVVGVDGPLSLTGQAIVAALALIALTALFVWLSRRRPYLMVGWFWYLGTLVPVIGLIRIGAHSVADRYTYLPAIGLYIMAIWAAAELAARSLAWRVALGTAAAAWLTIWTGLSVQQTAVWETSKKVFAHACDEKVVPRNFFAFNHLGLVYYSENDIEEAGRLFAKTVELAPNYDSGNLNLGVYYLHPNHNKLEQAAECFKTTAAINPRLACARSNLGVVYLRQSKLAEAAEEFLAAVEIQPDYDSAWQKLAMCSYDLKRYTEAAQQAFKAVQLSPRSAESYHILGMALLALRETDKATACLEEAVRLAPQNADLRNRLAVAYSQQGRLVQARSEFEKALAINPQHSMAQENLRRLKTLGETSPSAAQSPQVPPVPPKGK